MDQFSHFFTASLTNTSSLYQALTGHGWSQCAPCQPAVQTQEPSAALHFAPLVQWQVALHPGPQVPSEQGVEQSGPRQPAETSKTISHVWLFKQKICRPKFVPVHQDQVKHGLTSFYLLCRSKRRQPASSRQSSYRSTPESSSSHRCHFYTDSHSEPPVMIKHIINNNKPK